MTTYVLPFEKMHGLGNDFILLERRHLPNNVNEKLLARLICDRHFSVGADGIIIVDLSSTKDADFKWDYYNSDGSEAEMCGNGMRCFAKYVYERGFIDLHTFNVQTKAGIITPTLEEDGTVTINMGVPKLPSNKEETILLNSKEMTYTYIEIGNPHCVFILDKEITDGDFSHIGPVVEKHKKFPHGVNVEFAFVKNKNEIKLRVWERGAGPTLACGTGACATVIAANIRGFCSDNVQVHLPGGTLKIIWDKSKGNIFLNGAATFVYTGQFNLDPGLVCNKIGL